MRLLIKPVIAFLLVAVLCGCNFFKSHNPLCTSWKLVNKNGTEIADDRSGGRWAGAYLHLYDNYEYGFMNLFRYTSGRWQFNKADSTITLFAFKQGENDTIKVSSTDGEWLKGTMDAAHNEVLFKEDDYFEWKTIDLLKPERNKWRVKPGHKETHEEIRQRVAGHIAFARDYFKVLEENKSPTFRTIYLATPIKFYQHSLGLDDEEDLPEEWVDCFYDNDDAIQGYKLISSAIKSVNNDALGEESKTYGEEYYKALSQMAEFLNHL